MWWISVPGLSATNVPVSIKHAAGTARVTVDQSKNGGKWQLLGTYEFAAGTSSSVTISNAGTDGFVVADAIKFECSD